MRIKKTLFSSLLLIAFFVCHGQTKKAIKVYNGALLHFAEKKTDLAIKEMKTAIKLDSTWAEPYSFLGKWYMDNYQFNAATELYSRASLHCYNGKPMFSKAYSKSLIYNAQPKQALAIINKYSEPTDKGEWSKLRKQAEFIKNALENQNTVMPVSIGKKINTNDPEMFPSVSSDTSTLYFTRRVNNMDEDLFKAEMEDTCVEWKSVENLGPPINTTDQESAQFISADGHYLFYTRSDNRSENGWARGGSDLFMANRIKTDTTWTISQSFGATINTPYYEGMLSMSPDNKELYFVSDRPGGYGGLDIWVSRFDDGIWQLPINLGPAINSSGNDMAPYISNDNQTLYFTSNGRPGMGGNDLFISHRIRDTIWGAATNLGFPINTACDEMSCTVSQNGKYLYFASDRNGPAGNYDIYITRLPDFLKPVPICFVKGYVYDSLTSDRLTYAQTYIISATKGDTVNQVQSNKGDASYMVTLPVGTSYIFYTGRTGYTDVSDTLYLTDSNTLHPLIKNIVMLPFDYKEVKPINDSTIACVHFEPNHFKLDEIEKAIIHNAIAPWVDEKGITIYINAYTDDRGTPAINNDLSDKRAKQVSEEMVAVGINPVFIIAKGWGQAKMIATNETAVGRKLNRRVEILIKR